MTVSTLRQLVAFVLLAATGTLWNPIGATAVTTSTALGPEKFIPRQPTFARPQSNAEVRSLESNAPMSLEELFRLRGGEISIPDEDEEENSGLVVAKVRNVIRNLLRISDDKAPIVSGILRTCFKTIESLTGLDLLPKASEGKSKKSKSKSIKKSSDKTESAEKSKTKKKASSKKPSAAAKKHLETNIKSSNPNYRIQKELKAFLKSPPDNLSVQVGSNIRLWIVTMKGAKGTIYEGEVFKLRIEFPKDYPTVPPSVFFLKKHMPIHEHVYTNGDICLSLLGNGWRPTMSAELIATSILSILSSAQKKCLPMDNANHAGNKPGQYQKDWVYHDDNC